MLFVHLIKGFQKNFATPSVFNCLVGLTLVVKKLFLQSVSYVNASSLSPGLLPTLQLRRLTDPDLFKKFRRRNKFFGLLLSSSIHETDLRNEKSLPFKVQCNIIIFLIYPSQILQWSVLFARTSSETHLSTSLPTGRRIHLSTTQRSGHEWNRQGYLIWNVKNRSIRTWAHLVFSNKIWEATGGTYSIPPYKPWQMRVGGGWGCRLNLAKKRFP